MTEELLNLTKSLPNLTPAEIVASLDRYIIGQSNAKRACAIALRNRRRRQMVTGDLKDEILPKNILMIGATGVGKTEIARRLAKLAHSPFMKVEASKFTEVGYVGRDVESMIRDLMEISVNMVKEEQAVMVRAKATDLAVEKVLDLYHPPLRPAGNLSDEDQRRIEDRGSGRGDFVGVATHHDGREVGGARGFDPAEALHDVIVATDECDVGHALDPLDVEHGAVRRQLGVGREQVGEHRPRFGD